MSLLLNDVTICIAYVFATQHALNHASDDITDKGGVSVTDVTWVMVITWSQMVPRMYYRSSYDSVSLYIIV